MKTNKLKRVIQLLWALGAVAPFYVLGFVAASVHTGYTLGKAEGTEWLATYKAEE